MRAGTRSTIAGRSSAAIAVARAASMSLPSSTPRRIMTAKSWTSSTAGLRLDHDGEVGETRLAGLVVEHVVGRHGAVDDSGGLGADERPAHPGHEGRHLGGGEGPAGQAVGERPAVEAAHHHVRRSGLAPVVLQGHDRRVAERRHPVGRRLERAHELGVVGEVLVEDADRQFPVDTSETGGEHGAVPTGAEALTQSVSPQRLAGGLVEEERRVVGQDPPLQLLQRGRRVEAQLVGQRPPMLLERPEGVGVAPAPVEGEHELGLEGLPGRVLGAQRLQVRDELGRPAAGQLGVHQGLVGDDPELAQPLGLGSGPVLVGELGVGLALPERQGGAGRRRGSWWVLPIQVGAGLGQAALEPGDVQGVGWELERVPRRLGQDRGPALVAVLDDSTDAGDVAAHRRGGGGCGLAGEHGLGQPIHGHDGVGVDEEHGQEPSLAGPTDRDGVTALRDCQRTQCVELDHRTVPSLPEVCHLPR